MREDFSNALAEAEIRPLFLPRDIAVYDDQISAGVIAHQRGGRIYREGCSADDQAVRFLDQSLRAFPCMNRKRFAVQRDVRTDQSAAFAVRYRFFAVIDIALRVLFAAAVAIIAERGAVYFIDSPAPCFLMQTVNILRDNTVEFSLFFHFRKLYMGPVGKTMPCVHLLAVKLKENLGFMIQAHTAEQVFRLIAVKPHVMLIIQAVLAPEIRDPALSRYSCAAKKRDVLRVLNDLVQCLILGIADVLVPKCFMLSSR